LKRTSRWTNNGKWDPLKSEQTRQQRGFGFEYAARVFAGPTVEAVDRRRDYGEERVRAIGEIEGRVYVVVLYRSAWRALDHQRVEGKWQGCEDVAKQKRMTLDAVMAHEPDVDFAKIDATTEEDIRRHMREEGYDPDEAIRDEDIISPAVIRKRLGMSQRQFATAIRVPVATLQNWEQGRTPMDPSARALMTILAREPKAALRALGYERAA
jgi:putative transcriptional regulator